MILFRRFTFWLALAGLALAGVVVWRANLTVPVPPPPIAPPERPFKHAVGAAGLVEARHENIALGAPAAGLVTAVEVRPWAQVEAGQILLRLDDSELRARLITQAATIGLRTAELARVETRLARVRALRATEVVPASDLDDVLSDQAVAAAALAAARAEVAQTEALLARLLVRAPVAATVLQVNVRPGEYLAPGAATPALLLGRLDELQVRAEVDEQLAPRVRSGARAAGYLKGDGGQRIELTFDRIEPYVVPKRSLTGASTERVDTRVLQVIFRFAKPADRTIYVGQQLDLFIEEP